MGKYLLLAICMVALFYAFPSKAQTVPVDGSFSEGAIGFGKRGTFHLVAAPRRVQGRLAICGLTWTDAPNARLDSLRPEILDRVYFTLDGDLVHVDTDRFAKARSGALADGAQARCALSRLAWRPDMARAPFQMQMRDNRPIRY